MRATVLYGPGDIRFEERDDPKIVEPTDAIIRIAATCVCGSDLWPYRGLQPIQEQLDGKMVDWLEHVSDEQYRK
jgi:threonine dehydrogenase-like Zn-dependent dehydrogenase